MRRAIFHVVTLSLLLSDLNAQSLQNAGATGAQFLKIGVGARAMGMGGACASMSGDATLLAWNPAGIGTINGLQFSAQHTEWFADMRHSFLGLVVPLNEQFNLGLHTIFMTSGNIEITTIDNPEGTGQFYDVSDIAVGLTSSVRLTNQLTFAATVKYIEERIYDVKSGGVAIDAGAWYATGFRSLTLGFSLANLGFDQQFSGRPLEVRYDPSSGGEPPVKAELQTLKYSLPILFRASGSFDLFEMFVEPDPDNTLLAAIDFIQHSDTEERAVVGAEYSWQRTVSLRAGYEFNAHERSWSIGAGMRVSVAYLVAQFDYAASSLGRFGLSHRFGLMIGYE
jgi:hypothetical protein